MLSGAGNFLASVIKQAFRNLLLTVTHHHARHLFPDAFASVARLC